MCWIVKCLKNSIILFENKFQEFQQKSQRRTPTDVQKLSQILDRIFRFRLIGRRNSELVKKGPQIGNKHFTVEKYFLPNYIPYHLKMTSSIDQAFRRRCQNTLAYKQSGLLLYKRSQNHKTIIKSLDTFMLTSLAPHSELTFTIASM